MVGNAVRRRHDDRRLHGQARRPRAATPPTSWSTRRSIACPWSTATAAWSASWRVTTSSACWGSECSTTDSAPWRRSTSRPCVTTSPTSSRCCLPGTALCAVVKANGYGHGAVPVARAALQAGASSLGVATVTEAEELREAAIAAPLLVFGPLTGVEAARAARAHAEVTVWSQAFLAEALRRGARVHVKFNSGMGRLGVARAGGGGVRRRLGPARSPGLMSHFATADEDDRCVLPAASSNASRRSPRGSRRATPGLTAHTANSAATMREPAVALRHGAHRHRHLRALAVRRRPRAPRAAAGAAPELLRRRHPRGGPRRVGRLRPQLHRRSSRASRASCPSATPTASRGR